MTTQAETFKAIRALGFTVRKVDGEIQVKPAGSLWSGEQTYFTDDLADALGVATMAAENAARALAVAQAAQDLRVYARDYAPSKAGWQCSDCGAFAEQSPLCGQCRERIAREQAALADKDRHPIAWQTGCRYTVHGQRIAAVVVDGIGEQRAYFVDVDRGISGWFAVPPAGERGTLRTLVTTHYLRNLYSMPGTERDVQPLAMLRDYAIEHAPSLAERLPCGCLKGAWAHSSLCTGRKA